MTLLAFVVAASAATAAPQPQGRPNLLLISIDTLRADRLGCYGYRRPTSPNIDAFARRATLFEDAVAPSPKTATSHMTLFTGLHPSVHGIANHNEGSEQQLSDEIPTLATLLKRADYRTAAYTAGGNVHPGKGFGQGFDSYVSVEGEGGLGLGRLALEAHGKIPAHKRPPLFLFLHTYEVHDPYLPPGEYARLFTEPEYAGAIPGPEAFGAQSAGRNWYERHDIFWRAVRKQDATDVRHLSNLYDACVRRMDGRVGELLDALRDSGLEADTLVVFLSDHGEEFAEHGGFTHLNLFQEVLHVPLIVKAPARSAWMPGRVTGPAGLVDVLPTLLDMLGIKTPPHVQGRSLVSLVRGETRGRYAFAEWPADAQRALRIGNLKLVETPKHTRLYDLATDPGEREPIESGPQAYAMGLKIKRLTGGFAALKAEFAPGRKATIDEQTRRELQALGYLAAP